MFLCVYYLIVICICQKTYTQQILKKCDNRVRTEMPWLSWMWGEWSEKHQQWPQTIRQLLSPLAQELSFLQSPVPSIPLLYSKKQSQRPVQKALSSPCRKYTTFMLWEISNGKNIYKIKYLINTLNLVAQRKFFKYFSAHGYENCRYRTEEGEVQQRSTPYGCWKLVSAALV